MPEGRDFSGGAIYIQSVDGRVSVKAQMIIAGRHAELILTDWLDEDTPDMEAAARTALWRVALSFLEELESMGGGGARERPKPMEAGKARPAARHR